MRRSTAGQVVVITGASSGIGRCAARHLAARGARVVLTARRAAALEALAREIGREGGEAVAAPADVTSEAELAVVAELALERWGRIDTWVNNASVYLQGRVQDVTLEEYRRVLDVNLVGAINGTRLALGPMLRQGSGVVVLVSSIVGRRGAPYFSAYATAKAGLDGFAESLRAELWGTGVRISTLYPPSVDTPIYQHARGKFGTVPRPLPPVLPPERAARAIERLARTGAPELAFGAVGHLYMNMPHLPPRLADWVVHHFGEFTRSEIPDPGDNLDRPTDAVAPAERGGWLEEGWRGLTLRQAMRAIPADTLLAAAAVGFAAARALRR